MSLFQTLTILMSTIAVFTSLLSSIVYLYLEFIQFFVLLYWMLFVRFVTAIFRFFISHPHVLYHESVTKIRFALLNRCTSKLNRMCVSVRATSKAKSLASLTAVTYVFGVCVWCTFKSTLSTFYSSSFIFPTVLSRQCCCPNLI